MLNESNILLDAVEDMGPAHQELKRESHHRINTVKVAEKLHHGSGDSTDKAS